MRLPKIFESFYCFTTKLSTKHVPKLLMEDHHNLIIYYYAPNLEMYLIRLFFLIVVYY